MWILNNGSHEMQTQWQHFMVISYYIFMLFYDTFRCPFPSIIICIINKHRSNVFIIRLSSLLLLVLLFVCHYYHLVCNALEISNFNWIQLKPTDEWLVFWSLTFVHCKKQPLPVLSVSNHFSESLRISEQYPFQIAKAHVMNEIRVFQGNLLGLL